MITTSFLFVREKVVTFPVVANTGILCSVLILILNLKVAITSSSLNCD